MILFRCTTHRNYFLLNRLPTYIQIRPETFLSGLRDHTVLFLRYRTNRQHIYNYRTVIVIRSPIKLSESLILATSTDTVDLVDSYSYCEMMNNVL